MKKKKRDFKKAQDIRVSWNNYDELFTFIILCLVSVLL